MNTLALLNSNQRDVKMKTLFIFGLILMLNVGVAAAHNSKNNPHLIFAEHSLVGKIWDVNDKKFIDKKILVERILASHYILLGETHDNMVHHQNQAWVIENIKANNRRAIVSFEMINDQQGKLLHGHKITSSDILIKLLNQSKTGWEYQRHYKSLFDTVINSGFPIFPANLDRTQTYNIAAKGTKHLSAEIKKQLDKIKLTSEQKKILHEEIDMSHCQLLDSKMFAGMALVQRAKDVVMSMSMVNHRDGEIAVLIAGSGHVRNDRGVPVFIRLQDAKAKILALTWIEVLEESTSVDVYEEHWGSSQAPFNYIWFTPRVDRVDPCEALKKHTMKNKKKH